MTKEQITIEADKYNRSLSKHPMSVQELTEVLVGFYERLQLLQQTPCTTLLPCTHTYKTTYIGVGYVAQCTKCGFVRQ